MGGGDKALVPLAGRPILAHVVARARPQVSALALNANGVAERFAAFDLPVVEDVVAGFAGPLAGVLTGLTWAERHAPGCRWLASFACDAPFLPRDLVARLLAAIEREGAELACAASLGRHHPVFGLWPLAMRPALERAVVEEGLRKVDAFTGRYPLVAVDFTPIDTNAGLLDPFFNANRPEDLQQAERWLAALPAERGA